MADNINKVRKNLEENREHLEQSSKEIKGYGRTISKIIDPSTKEINFDNYLYLMLERYLLIFLI